MASSDGPFGSSSDIGVGFSDVALVVVSILGFGILASTVYSIVLLRLQTRDQFDKTQAAAGELGYDEQLEKANVATLNRAQRRARANFIMKRQRRAVQAPPQEDADALQEELLLDQEHELQQQHLTRKERQKAAKEAEKMERQLFQSTRHQQQKETLKQAQEQKRQRQVLQEEKMEAQRKQLVLQKEHQERVKYEQWKTFLASEQERMTVVEFIQYAKEHKMVNLQIISERFRISLEKVQARIKELVTSRRMSGIITTDLHFMYMTEEDLSKAAKLILTKQQGTWKNLVSEMQFD